VKFDRALIQSARAAQAEHKLVRAITAVCRDLGVATIAEGTENAKDVEVARLPAPEEPGVESSECPHSC
jgi:EAL domain-containing protein (putative c-di-GMP-specific phosphodiesterase class I)